MLRTVHPLLISLLVVGLWSFAPPAAAQRHAMASSNATARTDVDPMPGIPFADPDSTRNISAYGNFIRYETPSQCLAALQLASRELVRDRGRDTVFGPASIPEPLPATVSDIGIHCTAHLATTVLTPPELQSAFALAVLLNDQPRAATALDQWLAAPQIPLDRGETTAETQAKRLNIAIQTYLPLDLPGPQRETHLLRAKTLLARLAKLGSSARLRRFAMQDWILSREVEWRNQASGRFTDPQQVVRDLTAFLASIDSAGGMDGATDYGANPLILVVHLLDARFLLDARSTAAFADSLVHAMPHLQRVGTLLTLYSTMWSKAFLRPVASFREPFWYSTEGDTAWPVPGHVSLLVMGDLEVQQVAILRQLIERYGPHGLRVTIVTKTRGYWERGGTATGPRTAAQEAVQDSAYYLGYHNLPVTLGIAETQFTKEANGWFLPVGQANYETQGFDQSEVVMVDATGHLLMERPSFDPLLLVTYLDHVLGIASK